MNVELGLDTFGDIANGPDGQPLHDLHPVAGRILWRKQRELRAGRRADALDLGAPFHIRIDVEHNVRLMAGPHVRQLGLLEVRLDPWPAVADEGEQRHGGANVLAWLQLHADRGAAHGRANDRARQLERGYFEAPNRVGHQLEHDSALPFTVRTAVHERHPASDAIALPLGLGGNDVLVPAEHQIEPGGAAHELVIAIEA